MADAARRTAPPGYTGDDEEVARFAALYEQARAEGISSLNTMCELAGFAATFAQMTRNPLGAAQEVSREVMAE